MSVCLGRSEPGEWIYATAAHNFDIRPDKIYVGVGGKWVAASLIARTKDIDIALLRVKHAGNLKCASLADSGASGDRVFFHRRGGRRAIGSVKSSTQLIGVQPVLGDSGAAIYHSDTGDVVGIVRGYSMPGTTYYTPSHKVRGLILSTLGRLPTCGDGPQDEPPPPPPPPPKEEAAPDSHDHSEILSRLSEIEKRKPFDPLNLIIVNQHRSFSTSSRSIADRTKSRPMFAVSTARSMAYLRGSTRSPRKYASAISCRRFGGNSGIRLTASPSQRRTDRTTCSFDLRSLRNSYQAG